MNPSTVHEKNDRALGVHNNNENAPTIIVTAITDGVVRREQIDYPDEIIALILRIFIQTVQQITFVLYFYQETRELTHRFT